jgi:hypothetical protein
MNPRGIVLTVILLGPRSNAGLRKTDDGSIGSHIVDHVGHHNLTAIECPGQDLIPFFGGDGEEGTETVQASAAHEQRWSTQTLPHFLNARIDLGPVGNVDLDAYCAGALADRR